MACKFSEFDANDKALLKAAVNAGMTYAYVSKNMGAVQVLLVCLSAQANYDNNQYCERVDLCELFEGGRATW